MTRSSSGASSGTSTTGPKKTFACRLLPGFGELRDEAVHDLEQPWVAVVEQR
jgi:hypothetical protein